MRKFAVTLALASTALATPAFARDDAWYVGVEGGAMIVEDIDYTINGVSRAGRAFNNNGWDVDAIIGYDFGGFRAEAEVGYRRATIDTWQASVTTPYYTAAGTIANIAPGTFDYVGGRTSALSFMLNGLVDFGDDDGIQGFIGGGVGVARISADYALTTRGSWLDDSDTVFAWQAIAGLRQPISDNIDVTLKYRFFNADNVRLVDVTGRVNDGRYRSHSIVGGIVFNFGRPPEPIPVAPRTPPAEPPAPPVVPCTPGPYIVFFDWDKSDITPEAASILDNAVSAYQNCGNAQVMLAGHADRSGSATYNVGLSQRRADAVRAYLSSRGIADGQISTEAFGESRPRVETADGVRELLNRRVEVTYGPGSGQ